MSYLCFDFVIPACPESFWKKDPGQARMTENRKDFRSAECGGVTEEREGPGEILIMPELIRVS
jgi:hypothetical protein